MYPPIPRNEWVRAIWVRADNEIITKSMNRVSAKTANGNQVPKGGRLNRRRRSDGSMLLETTGAGVVKLMPTSFGARTAWGSDVPGFLRTIRRVSQLGNTTCLLYTSPSPRDGL